MSIIMIDYDMKYIKGVVHRKMKILSSLTHPRGDPNLTCMTDLLLKKKINIYIYISFFIHFMVSETLRDLKKKSCFMIKKK